MGNRAVITRSLDDNAPAIYLHWNGGRNSVEAFLKVAQCMAFENETSEGWNEFAVFLSKHFFNYGGKLGMTIYREPYGHINNPGDNGIFQIDQNWNITNRLKFKGQEQYNHNSNETAAYILNRHLGYDEEIASKMAAEEVAQ